MYIFLVYGGVGGMGGGSVAGEDDTVDIAGR